MSKILFLSSIAVLFIILKLGAQAGLTDSQIKKMLIEESTSKYPGSCPCPYNTDRANRRCGGRSAYLKPGGYIPYCYEKDITANQIINFKKHHKIP